MRLAPLIVLLSSSLCWATAACAGDDCDSLAARIVAQTGATFVRKAPGLGNVMLSHAAASGGFSVTCSNGKPAGINLAYEGSATPRFFGLASASVAEFLGSRDPGLIKVAGTCLLAAKVDPTGFATRDSAKVTVECTVGQDGDDGSLAIGRLEP